MSCGEPALPSETLCDVCIQALSPEGVEADNTIIDVYVAHGLADLDVFVTRHEEFREWQAQHPAA